MLEVLVRLFCGLILTLTGYYIICKIIYKEVKAINRSQMLLMLILALISTVLYPIKYSIVYSLSIFFLNVIIYRVIFKINLEKSIISCGLLMIILFLADILSSLIFMSRFEIAEIRTSLIIIIFCNIVVSLISIGIVNITKLRDQLNKFYSNIIQTKYTSNIIFIVLIIVDFSYLLYNIGKSDFFNKQYTLNFLAMIIFIMVTYIFIQNRNEYKNLENKYDMLFSYTQTFEDWIEKEQLNRHEYKNQLAVLRCLTKEKKVKEKIDEILEDNINIEGQAVTNLKNLPKGGIKGLMYYKAAIAQKHKINLTTDVSIESKGILTKLSEKEIRIICKLIGIYFDNAIEAATESKKKNVTVEIYELKDKVNFVFSNTFKKHKNMKDRNKKGVSSKGEGRGNGLYFASKLIKENPWITDRQEIIDNYYIQEISIKNPQKKGF